MGYQHWNPETDQTPEARAAVQAWAERKMSAGETLDPHDPEMLICLDKGDIVSRYLLLLEQSNSRARQDREYHESERRRLVAAVENAARWWSHCVELRRRGRKTAQLSDMPDRGVGSDAA